MARGVRKTTKERLEENLVQYKQLAERLQKDLAETNEKIAETETAIQLEDFKEVSMLMETSGVDFEQLKLLLKKAQKNKNE